MTEREPPEVLVIVDHLGAGAFENLGGSRVTILPLGTGVHAYERAMSSSLRRLDMRVFPVGSVADGAARAVRERYPDFVYREIHRKIAGGTSLLELLDGDGINYWWFTDTSEKSPLRTAFINQIYRLAVVKAVLDAKSWQGVRVSLRDRALAEAIGAITTSLGMRSTVEAAPRSFRWMVSRLRYHSLWLRFGLGRPVTAMRYLGNLAMLRMHRIGRTSIQDVPVCLISSWYPSLYSSPEGLDCRERILGSLVDLLHQHGPTWQVVRLELWPWQILARGRRLAAVFDRARIVPLLLFNSPGDVLHACFAWEYGKKVLQWCRLSRRLRVRFGDWDVSALWREEINRSLSGYGLVSNILVYRALRNLATRFKPKLLIHPTEFQPVDRAIWAALRGTETRSVALQHSSMSSNTLSYFFADGELPAAVALPPARFASPIPDYYVTTGDWPLAVIRGAGFPKQRSTVVGPLRYGHLLRRVHSVHRSTSGDRMKLQAGRIAVLVATSSSRSEALSLVEVMRASVPSLPPSILLLFKSHYAFLVDSYVRRAFADVPEKNWGIIGVDANLAEYLSLCDAVVLTNSTVCLEAVVLSCPPIILHESADLNVGPLIDTPHAALFADSPRTIADAIAAACDREVRQKMQSSWPEVIARNFHTLEGDAGGRLLAWLEPRIFLSATPGS